MRHKIVSLDTQMNLIGTIGIEPDSEDNKKDRQKMRELMKKTMIYYLTPRQQQCVTMYYFESKTVVQIGKELGLDKSTVSRHIKAAMKKLKKLNAFV